MTRKRIATISRRGGSPSASDNKSAYVRAEDFEHVCLSLKDPEIPHTVKFGRHKGRGAFATKREVKEFEAKLRDRGMGHLAYDK